MISCSGAAPALLTLSRLGHRESWYGLNHSFGGSIRNDELPISRANRLSAGMLTSTPITPTAKVEHQVLRDGLPLDHGGQLLTAIIRE